MQQKNIVVQGFSSITQFNIIPQPMLIKENWHVKEWFVDNNLYYN